MITPITAARPIPRLLSIALGTVILGCGIATLFAHLGGTHWFLNLFSHFTILYAVALALLVAICFATRRRRLGILASLILLPNLIDASYYYFPRAYTAAEPNLRVVSYNVLRTNSNHAEALAFLQSTDADIIALIEVDQEWLTALSPLEETHPHIAHIPNNHNFGLALYSKHPVAKFRRPMPTRGHPLLLAQIDFNGSLLHVVVAHPVPPVSKAAADIWREYLTKSAEQVSLLEGPILFMGDFNATPWSSTFPGLIESTKLQDSGRGHGFQSTWKRSNLLFNIPIDHVLHSSELQPTARSIGPSNGSDHSPLLVDFAFSPTLPIPPKATLPTRPRPAPGPETHPRAPDSGQKPRVRRAPSPAVEE